MRNTRLKLFPPFLMLVAGSITSIMTYHFQYEFKTALLVLLSVLLVFYIIGLVAMNVINCFDEKNERELAEKEAEKRRLEEELAFQEEMSEEIDK